MQVASLCWRRDGAGRPQVLLITSRDTGRWILPKGWTMKGRSRAEAAAQEAWEEAGVSPAPGPAEPVGRFDYDKRLEDGVTIPCRVEVFGMEVEKLARDFPEAGQRRRRWVSPDAAARMVEEPQLQALLRAFAPAPTPG